MPEIPPEEIKSIMAKYRNQLKKRLDIPKETFKKTGQTSSREYRIFKDEIMPKHMSYYEKLCNFSEKILKIKPDKKKLAALQESISICHLNVTPTGVTSFAILAPLIIIFFGSFFGYVLTGGTFFVIFFMLIGAALLGPLGNIPHFIANNWRMKASNQMVLCVFYVVTYMRHTSNLELAIDFASEHLAPPLSLDLRKVLWDVETEKYESIKESLDNYLETWRKWNLEFIESFHLIESSLYEGIDERRLDLLDKSLDVILSETYEKMVHYAHNLQSPLTMLHMLGIILPILGLVILPLVVSFMEGVKWYHLATLYNVALPVGVYYLGKSILSKRPTGYGDTDISKTDSKAAKAQNILLRFGKSELKISPMYLAVIVGLTLFLIGLSPVIMHLLNPEFDLDLFGGKFQLLGYKVDKAGQVIGPYGLGAAILGIFIGLSFGLGVGLYYKLKSQDVIKIRERSKKLEKEFASALFQLGNRLGDGLPAEIAFGKVATLMQGTTSGKFFSTVSQNIRRLGMSVKQAIFDVKTGALAAFPSDLIRSSMKVLVESIKKGPSVAAQALTNISQYVKEIHKVNERLKDLMAETISSMKSQIKFLTPAIAGIVIGITSMVTTILGKLSTQIGDMDTGTIASLPELFGDGVPTYFFQIIVAIYVVQIIYILTILVNGIENGTDKLNERFLLGKNLIRSTFLYSFVALTVMLIFNMIASQIMRVAV